MHKKYLKEIGKRLDYVKKAEQELKKNGIERDNYEQTEHILKQIEDRLWTVKQSKRIIKYQQKVRIGSKRFKI